MNKSHNVTIKNKYLNRYKSGNPLILKETVNIKETLEEGRTISLFDQNSNFIGKGYYGKQNKGIGWILSKNKEEAFDEAFFNQKLGDAFTYRKGLFNHKVTNAYRLFNGEGDGIGGLTIDYFDGYYVVTWYNQGIYTYADYVYDFIEKKEGFRGIYTKRRFNAAGKYIDDDDFVRGKQGTFPMMVKENNMNYAIYLNEGAMVGVFLDQREVRKCLRNKYSKDKTVLNTFSYTGAFSVAAALGGASKTVSVDLANRSRAKTTEHFEINAIEVANQEIIVEDVFNYFKYAIRKQLKFDVVVLDPPSFAKSKKFIFSASKDYVNLLKNTIDITADNGLIIASTNCSTFDIKKFKEFIKTAFSEKRKSYEILESYQLPKDFKTINTFKEGNYLKVVFIQVKN